MLLGGSRANLHDLQIVHVAWVGSVLYRSCTSSHNMAGQGLDDLSVVFLVIAVDDIFVDEISIDELSVDDLSVAYLFVRRSARLESCIFCVDTEPRHADGACRETG